MKADFTRTTFDAAKHFSAVLLQQGRVQVDADWNELVDILHHLDRAARIDEVGSCGAPVAHAGFEISEDGDGGLQIGPGRFYVDGILCEAAGDDPIPLTDQPHLGGAAIPTGAGVYALVLDVHERLITSLENDALREIALGGADHAVRTEVVWQVRAVWLGDLGSDFNCVTAHDSEPYRKLVAGSDGWLQVETTEIPTNDDPCTVPAQAGYRGLENQLYRVEIHDGQVLQRGEWITNHPDDEITYKWSRENGTVVARWLATPKAGTLSLSSVGQDQRRGFEPGQHVELISGDHELRREPGPMRQVAAVEADGVRIDVVGTVPDHETFGAHPRVRRWDGEGGVAEIKEAWRPLELGLQVKFEKSGVYQTGDYWLIPARSITGDVLLPKLPGNPSRSVKLPPMGPTRHYCMLALASCDGAGSWALLEDCRPTFPAATKLETLDHLGGDGQEAMPGRWLPLPVRVGVSNGSYPIEGARVRFTVRPGDGWINTSKAMAGAVADDAKIVTTNGRGEAQVFWRLPVAPPQPGTGQLRVVADLLDPDDNTIHLQVRFAAQLSVASEVWYDNRGCGHLAELPDPVDTVQGALDAFCANHELYYVSGDGQEGLPDQALPVALQARVGNGAWNVPDAVVRFALADPAQGTVEALPGLDVVDRQTTTETVGGTIVTRTTQLRVKTGGDGRIGVRWTLGRRTTVPHQQVIATLLRDDGAGGLAETDMAIAFNGTIARARNTRFDARCGPLRGATTVADALDALCGNHALHYVSGDGQQGRPGRVLPVSLRVRVGNGGWPAQAHVMFEVLATQSYGRHLSLEDAGAVKGTNPAPWGRGRGEVWSDKYVVRTDERGLAQAQWMLGRESRLRAQRVRATLLDADKQPTDQHVIFAASVASIEPRVSAIYQTAAGALSEVSLLEGGAVPVASFFGLRFHDLLVRTPPPQATELDWWSGVEIAIQFVYDDGTLPNAYSWVVFRGVVQPLADGSLIWWLQRPEANTLLDGASFAQMHTFHEVSAAVAASEGGRTVDGRVVLGGAEFAHRREAFAEMLIDGSRAITGREPVLEHTLYRRGSDGRIVLRDPDLLSDLTELSVDPSSLARPHLRRRSRSRRAPGAATPTTAGVAELPEFESLVETQRLMRIQLRPRRFPGRCAENAADFELYFWLDLAAKFLVSHNG